MFPQEMLFKFYVFLYNFMTAFYNIAIECAQKLREQNVKATICVGGPHVTIVEEEAYNKEFDYEIASDEGKKINDKFENCGLVFYDTESGIKSFERIVNDLLTFQKAHKRTIRRFQEEIAYPVSKNEFIQKLKGII